MKEAQIQEIEAVAAVEDNAEHPVDGPHLGEESCERITFEKGRISAMDLSAERRDTLSALGARVFANRHHNLVGGTAGDEVKAARAAYLAACDGVSHHDIAAAMHLPVSEIISWIGTERPPTPR